MISDDELKKILSKGKESYSEEKLYKMIELIKRLGYLDYEMRKRRKYAK